MIIKKIGAFLLMFALLTGIASASDLEEKNVLDGKVTLLSPKDFGPMSEEMLALKYPSANRPTEVLSNESGSVNLSFNHSASQVPDDADTIHKALSGGLHNAYAGAEWISEGVVTVNGQKFAAFEVITPAADTKIHNIIYATQLDGTLLLISFNTTVEDAPKWLEAGKKMMASIKINKK